MALLTFLSGPSQPLRRVPTAKAVISPENAVLGAVVRLDGSLSSDLDARPPRQGTDAAVSDNDTVSSASADFSQDDLGRFLRLGNLGDFFIYEVLSDTQVRIQGLDGAGVALSGSDLQWTVFDRLTFSWTFVATPVGSVVRQEGFRVIEADGSLVSFSPDIVGEYVVELTVSNGTYDSIPVRVQSSVRAILVPHGRGLVPDGKFIWSFVRDVWSQVDGKEWFETLWSALLQICGGELLKLYQVDFSKSIRDVQDQYQRRWLSYEPKLSLLASDLTFYVGKHLSSGDASSDSVGLTGQLLLLPTDVSPATWQASHGYAVGDVVTPTSGDPAEGHYFRCQVAGTSSATQPSWKAEFGQVTADGTARWALYSMTKELVLVSGSLLPNAGGELLTITYDDHQPLNLRSYEVKGVTVTKNGYVLAQSSPPPDPLPNRVAFGVDVLFSFQSRTWSVVGPMPDIRVGDVAHFPAGPNAGFFLITKVDGSTLTVEDAPRAFSDMTTLATYAPSVYRPVGFRLEIPAPILTDTFAVPYVASADANALAPGRIVTFGGQAYTLLRSSLALNQQTPSVLLTVDRPLVLGNQRGVNWRAPHTLVSGSQNFEELGVSSGDLLIISIIDDESQGAADVVAQVVGVDRSRLGFVLTDDVIAPGTVPPIPNKTFIDLSNAFNIGTVITNQNGEIFLQGEVRKMVTEIGTTIFQRAYANKKLTPTDGFLVGGRTFHAVPKHIIRNRFIPVDESLRSIPLLQEWIVQPTTGKRDGQLFQSRGGKEFPLTRAPALLIENADYIINAGTAYDSEMTFDSGTDLVFSEGASFIDRNIQPGDAFIIDGPEDLVGEYKIIRTLDNERLLLASPVPLSISSTTVTARVRIERQKKGHYLRFVPGVFSAKTPAPARLWAEVSLFDNNETIENNFGILVGLTRADIESISSNVNYRQAVAGLMFAFTKGSAIEKIRLGAQILLGLPFAEHRGVIRSIDNDYRLDASGVPVLGRMVIEDVDKAGTPLGTQRIYTFAIDSASSLSGVETNPVTKKTYVVGDIVELFALLSKGVEITDYLSNPGSDLSAISQLQQFHAFHMRANDIIFSNKELGLISPFLRQITPSYVAFIITITTELADDVLIEDVLTMALNTGGAFIDNPYFGLDVAMNYDSRTIAGVRTIFWDGSVYEVRKSGASLESTALSGAPGSPQTLTLPGGGLVTPEFGNGPVTRAGRDKLIIVDGPNQGLYSISNVSDGSIEVSDGPAYGFQPSATNRFAVGRPVVGRVRSGTLSSSGSGAASLGVGLVADGVAAGDLLVVDLGSGAYSRHFISRVGPHPDATPLLDGEAETVPGVAAVTGRPYAIFRLSLCGSPFDAASPLVSNGTAYTAFGDPLLQGLLEPGDELEVNGGEFGRLFVADPVRRVFLPVLPAGTYSVKVCRRGQPAQVPSFDQVDLGPADPLELALTGDSASTSSGSNAVSFTEIPNPAANNIKPADILALLSGADSTVDVGYGPGRYPIIEVTASDVRLAAPLTGSGSVGWQIIRSV